MGEIPVRIAVRKAIEFYGYLCNQELRGIYYETYNDDTADEFDRIRAEAVTREVQDGGVHAGQVAGIADGEEVAGIKSTGW